MRRKDRETDEAAAWAVADKCEWAVLSLVTPEAAPYCVPLSIVREGRTVFFHSARSGFKTDCLRRNPDVCLVCVGDTCRLTDEFSTRYESAILRGRAGEVLEDAEKLRALRLLCQRHVPANMRSFDAEAAKDLRRTAVWRIEVSEITGKKKQ